MAIYFYRINEVPYGVFSNFSAHPFTLDGLLWPTSEHYFQAQKFVGFPEHQEAIRLAATPMEAAEKGRERHRPLRPDWNAVRDEAMRRALAAKFAAHSELTELLLSTGNETLVEKTTTDYYWGCGTDGTGKNRLGELLMETRTGYQSE
ncbi:NADAR family protein [Armatimonas sp.]|uniref:NADAR family protein n=1 Tax=Armatimonas sp. TaxID=1872638 RepID=UPI00286D3BE9|nr:NADAR family protein [Armatimonas sp.]